MMNAHNLSSGNESSLEVKIFGVRQLIKRLCNKQTTNKLCALKNFNQIQYDSF